MSALMTHMVVQLNQNQTIRRNYVESRWNKHEAPATRVLVKATMAVDGVVSHHDHHRQTDCCPKSYMLLPYLTLNNNGTTITNPKTGLNPKPTQGPHFYKGCFSSFEGTGGASREHRGCVAVARGIMGGSVGRLAGRMELPTEVGSVLGGPGSCSLKHSHQKHFKEHTP
jgi:hypothetical protein